jgi:leucyl aminopeptidase
MPDGNAQRPGDVVTSMSGQTIEVINTDAEGRLVLADALWYTQRNFKPKAMVDLATLTGAMIIALGHDHAGLFSNDDGLAEKLTAAGKAVGDRLWRMPLGEAVRQADRIADRRHEECRPARGRLDHRGAFIQRFVESGVKWAHLDIAGMAWSDKAGTLYDKGATGFGVGCSTASWRTISRGDRPGLRARFLFLRFGASRLRPRPLAVAQGSAGGGSALLEAGRARQMG